MENCSISIYHLMFQVQIGVTDLQVWFMPIQIMMDLEIQVIRKQFLAHVLSLLAMCLIFQIVTIKMVT